MKVFKLVFALSLLILSACNQFGRVYHVSTDGNDSSPGTMAKPLKTISAAADRAMPGDTITVHEGVYRERINPPIGGSSEESRIVYRAAEGEKVVITGTEKTSGWEFVNENTWMITLPNSFFGEFNPYQDTIAGDWFYPLGRTHHTGAVYLNGHWLTESANMEALLQPQGNNPLWYSKSDISETGNTTIWAQFADFDPNNEEVEINVRQSVFYPEKTGINYITVSGFVLEKAATPWSPPTAEQIGLIGTNWSKGWIIENNTIRYSTCVGVTLGKHGDEYDNTSADSAEGYVKTIERATANGWSKDNIGHHIVRNNEISHCEQAGLVGSMGAVFSTIAGNEIHNIHIRRLFTGAEMAGIKIHGAIDTEIKDNHIYRANRGIWLDWMTQGARVAGNLLHDNGPSEDLFLEMNHGPFLVDNNIALSDKSLLINSQGGAYAHNLFAGSIYVITGDKRFTPHMEAHSTKVTGLAENSGGDERYYNNIFISKGKLSAYDKVKLPVLASGNVFLNGAEPGRFDPNAIVDNDFDTELDLQQINDNFILSLNVSIKWIDGEGNQLISSEILGKAITPDLPFENIDGSEFLLNSSYFPITRTGEKPVPGPIEFITTSKIKIRVWPKK